MESKDFKLGTCYYQHLLEKRDNIRERQHAIAEEEDIEKQRERERTRTYFASLPFKLFAEGQLDSVWTKMATIGELMGHFEDDVVFPQKTPKGGIRVMSIDNRIDVQKKGHTIDISYGLKHLTCNYAELHRLTADLCAYRAFYADAPWMKVFNFFRHNFKTIEEAEEWLNWFNGGGFKTTVWGVMGYIENALAEQDKFTTEREQAAKKKS